MRELTDGPYIAAIGWIDRAKLIPVAFPVREAGGRRPPVDFSPDGRWSLHAPLSEQELTAALPTAFLKSAHVVRARNAARSAIFAANLARALHALIPRRHMVPDGIAVSVATGSSTTAIRLEYEIGGLVHGWEKTDTMLLPGAVLSAVSTQIAKSLNVHASAATFVNGILGFCCAVEHAHLLFFHERADMCLVIGAEEVCPARLEAMKSLGATADVVDGASGLLLSRFPLPGGWRLRVCANHAPGEEIVLPLGWGDASRLRIESADGDLVPPATLGALAIQRLIAGAGGKVVLHCAVPELGRFVLGFERCLA